MKTLRTTLFAKKNKHHNDNSEGSTNRATAPPCYLDGQFYNLVNEGKSAGGLLPFFDANNNNQSRNRHMDSQVNIRSGSGHSLGDNSSNNHSQFQYQESLSRHALSKNNKNALSPNDIGGNNASSHTGGSGKPRSPFPLGNSNYANSILITKNNREKYNMFSPSLSELNFSNQYKLVSFDFDESLHSNSHHSSSPFSRGGYGSISTSNSSKSITADSSSVNPNANNEWLAYNTIFLFQNTKSLWKIVSILMAQEEHSKVMNMPTHPDKRVDDNYKIDDTTIYKETMHKKMIKCSPPEYVNFAFNEINALIGDTTEFPTKYGEPFKSSFIDDTIKKILRLIINVLGHFYTQLVFMRLHEQGLHTRLNRVFSHAVMLVKNAELTNVIDMKNHCLNDLISVLTER